MGKLELLQLKQYRFNFSIASISPFIDHPIRERRWRSGQFATIHVLPADSSESSLSMAI